MGLVHAKVLTPAGEFPLEQIGLGQHVITFDENKNIVKSRVSNIFHGDEDHYYRLTLDNGKKVDVVNKSFLTPSGFVNLAYLCQGDSIYFLEENKMAPHKIKEILKVNQFATSMDIEVEGTHTYFANGMAMHNPTSSTSGGSSSTSSTSGGSSTSSSTSGYSNAAQAAASGLGWSGSSSSSSTSGGSSSTSSTSGGSSTSTGSTSTSSTSGGGGGGGGSSTSSTSGGGGGGGGGSSTSSTSGSTTGQTNFTLLFNNQTGTWQYVSDGVLANTPAGVYTTTAPSSSGSSSTSSTSGGGGGGATPGSTSDGTAGWTYNSVTGNWTNPTTGQTAYSYDSSQGFLNAQGQVVAATTSPSVSQGVPVQAPAGTTWIPRSDLPGGGFYRAFVNGQQLDWGAGANAVLNRTVTGDYYTSKTTETIALVPNGSNKAVNVSVNLLADAIAKNEEQGLPKTAPVRIGDKSFNLTFASGAPGKEGSMPGQRELILQKAEQSGPYRYTQDVYDEFGKKTGKKEDIFFRNFGSFAKAERFALGQRDMAITAEQKQNEAKYNLLQSKIAEYEDNNAHGVYKTAAKYGVDPQIVREIKALVNEIGGSYSLSAPRETAAPTAQAKAISSGLGTTDLFLDRFKKSPVAAPITIKSGSTDDIASGKFLKGIKTPWDIGNLNAESTPLITSGSNEQSFLSTSGFAYGAGTNASGYSDTLARLGLGGASQGKGVAVSATPTLSFVDTQTGKDLGEKPGLLKVNVKNPTLFGLSSENVPVYLNESEVKNTFLMTDAASSGIASKLVEQQKSALSGAVVNKNGALYLKNFEEGGFYKPTGDDASTVKLLKSAGATVTADGMLYVSPQTSGSAANILAQENQKNINAAIIYIEGKPYLKSTSGSAIKGGQRVTLEGDLATTAKEVGAQNVSPTDLAQERVGGVLARKEQAAADKWINVSSTYDKERNTGSYLNIASDFLKSSDVVGKLVSQFGKDTEAIGTEQDRVYRTTQANNPYKILPGSSINPLLVVGRAQQISGEVVQFPSGLVEAVKDVEAYGKTVAFSVGAGRGGEAIDWSLNAPKDRAVDTTFRIVSVMPIGSIAKAAAPVFSGAGKFVSPILAPVGKAVSPLSTPLAGVIKTYGGAALTGGMAALTIAQPETVQYFGPQMVFEATPAIVSGVSKLSPFDVVRTQKTELVQRANIIQKGERFQQPGEMKINVLDQTHVDEISKARMNVRAYGEPDIVKTDTTSLVWKKTGQPVSDRLVFKTSTTTPAGYVRETDAMVDVISQREKGVVSSLGFENEGVVNIQPRNAKVTFTGEGSGRNIYSYVEGKPISTAPGVQPVASGMAKAPTVSYGGGVLPAPEGLPFKYSVAEVPRGSIFKQTGEAASARGYFDSKGVFNVEVDATLSAAEKETMVRHELSEALTKDWLAKNTPGITQQELNYASHNLVQSRLGSTRLYFENPGWQSSKGIARFTSRVPTAADLTEMTYYNAGIAASKPSELKGISDLVAQAREAKVSGAGATLKTGAQPFYGVDTVQQSKFYLGSSERLYAPQYSASTKFNPNEFVGLTTERFAPAAELPKTVAAPEKGIATIDFGYMKAPKGSSEPADFFKDLGLYQNYVPASPTEVLREVGLSKLGYDARAPKLFSKLGTPNTPLYPTKTYLNVEQIVDQGKGAYVNLPIDELGKWESIVPRVSSKVGAPALPTTARTNVLISREVGSGKIVQIEGQTRTTAVGEQLSLGTLESGGDSFSTTVINKFGRGATQGEILPSEAGTFAESAAPKFGEFKFEAPKGSIKPKVKHTPWPKAAEPKGKPPIVGEQPPPAVGGTSPGQLSVDELRAKYGQIYAPQEMSTEEISAVGEAVALQGLKIGGAEQTASIFPALKPTYAPSQQIVAFRPSFQNQYYQKEQMAPPVTIVRPSIAVQVQPPRAITRQQQITASKPILKQETAFAKPIGLTAQLEMAKSYAILKPIEIPKPVEITRTITAPPIAITKSIEITAPPQLIYKQIELTKPPIEITRQVEITKVPPYTPGGIEPFVPVPPPPFIPGGWTPLDMDPAGFSLGGSGVQAGRKGARRNVLANLLSVTRSQWRYGKATHGSMERYASYYGLEQGGAILTVEELEAAKQPVHPQPKAKYPLPGKSVWSKLSMKKR